MLWSALMHPVGFVVDLVSGARRTVDAKDLERFSCVMPGCAILRRRDW